MSNYILTRSDLDKAGYLLVGNKLEDITQELEKLVRDPSYVIVRNKEAIMLQHVVDGYQ